MESLFLIWSRLEVFCKKGGLRPATLFKKETPAQVFSCKFREISKNSFSYRTPPVAASAIESASIMSAIV